MSNRWIAREWLRIHPLGADILLALGIFLLWMLAYSAASGLGSPRQLAPDLIFSLLGIVPVMFRRAQPWIAVVGLTVALMVPALAGRSAGAVGLALLVVAYTAASRLSLREAAPAFLLLGTGLAVALTGPGTGGFQAWLANILILVVCFFIGRTVQTRRAYTEALEERARVAEENRESAARQAVLDERRRIARELHDVVAHHISVMGVMAAGARRTLHRDLTTADEALATIEDTGRSTLREMRRLLDVLRADDEAIDALVEPQPGVAGLERLAVAMTEAGVPVRLVVEGEAASLEPGVELAVYRIVQEGLTNTLKHAGRASAEVRLRYREEAVEVEVLDDGRGPRPADSRRTSGHGLVGMRERVSLYGGTLTTGARRDGGYRVHATLPVERASVRLVHDRYVEPGQ
jgi:signal transduction histidine kinase